MDKHELIKTAVTAIIAVLAKELLSWFVTTSKKLGRRQQARTAQESVDAATPAPPTKVSQSID